MCHIEISRLAQIIPKNKVRCIWDGRGVGSNDPNTSANEYVGSGRHPLPIAKRPAIPERPAEDSGSADEDDADEKPQVFVLKKGEHLTECKAENVRRSGEFTLT